MNAGSLLARRQLGGRFPEEVFDGSSELPRQAERQAHGQRDFPKVERGDDRLRDAGQILQALLAEPPILAHLAELGLRLAHSETDGIALAVPRPVSVSVRAKFPIAIRVDAGTVIDEVSTMASKSVGKFGAKVSQLRKERRLSQEELAERSGVSQTFVSKMEKAETQETAGTPALVAKVLAFLDTDANKIKDLLLDEDPDGAMVGAEERAPDPSSAYDFGIDDFGPAAADSPGGTVPVAAVPPRVDPMEARRVWQEARAKERDDLMARGFLFDKTTESTQGAYGEVVDALGRAFDHRVHRLTDTHIILEMLDSTMGSSKESRARLVDCWPQELDIGCRLALNAVKQLRRQGIPITLKNVFIALAVFAGREVVKANAGRDVYLSEPPPADVPDMPF